LRGSLGDDIVWGACQNGVGGDRLVAPERILTDETFAGLPQYGINHGFTARCFGPKDIEVVAVKLKFLHKVFR
jgi:hypothetical protein